MFGVALSINMTLLTELRISQEYVIQASIMWRFFASLRMTWIGIPFSVNSYYPIDYSMFIRAGFGC